MLFVTMNNDYKAATDTVLCPPHEAQNCESVGLPYMSKPFNILGAVKKVIP